MIIEILAGHNQPLTKMNKENKPYYQQKAYAHLGGAFPVEFLLSIQTPAEVYPVGKYTLDEQSYRVNQWGRLEISGFDMKLRPLAKSVEKAS